MSARAGAYAAQRMRQVAGFVGVLSALAMTVLAMTVPAQAQPSPDRSSVAQVRSGDRQCTGTLIAADTILTAAHCLLSASGTRRPSEAITVHFGDTARAVRHWYAAKDYAAQDDAEAADAALIARDVALLHLARAVPRQVATPMTLHPAARRGMPVWVITANATPSEPCTLVRGYRDGVLEFDCLVGAGASGAPVVARFGDGWRVVSVISALAVNEQGAQRAFGMVLGPPVRTLQAELHRARVRTRAATGARHVGAGERGDPGARFVKP